MRPALPPVLHNKDEEGLRSADHVFFAGDPNYQIDLPRERVGPPYGTAVRNLEQREGDNKPTPSFSVVAGRHDCHSLQDDLLAERIETGVSAVNSTGR